jgi:predicted dehydrogenase
MKPLRYGMVGGGFVAAFHCRALVEVRGVEVAGFVSKDPVDKLVAFVKEQGLGEPRVFSSIRQMAPEVDVIGIFAVKAGAQLKGIIAEKPFARNMAEGRRILELVDGLDVPTAYFENQIHMKSVQAQRAQLAPLVEAMGPPTLTRSGEEHGGPHSGWFWDPTQQGGGVMSDMGCHCLAVGWYALIPLGKPVRFLEPESVMADLSLLKWGQPRWRKELLDRHGVD